MKLVNSPKFLLPTNAVATNTHKEMCVNVNMELPCLAEKTVFYNADKITVFNRHCSLIGWTRHCHVQHCCREEFFRTFLAGRSSKGDKNKTSPVVHCCAAGLPPCRSSSFIPQWIHEWMNLLRVLSTTWEGFCCFDGSRGVNTLMGTV